MGVTDFVFEIRTSKAKIIIAMETDYVKIIDKTYLAIIHLSNNTILLLLIVTKWFNDSVKQQGL